jgi:hypothetical protein
VDGTYVIRLAPSVPSAPQAAALHSETSFFILHSAFIIRLSPLHHFVAIPSPDENALPAQAAGASNPEHVAAIKRWTREYLKLGDEAVVTVSEFACADAGCPLLETVIAVFEERKTRYWKLTRPRVAVTKLMVHQTLATVPSSAL